MGLQNSTFSTQERLFTFDDLLNIAYLKSPNSDAFAYFQSVITSKYKESLEAAVEELGLLAKHNEEVMTESEHKGPRGQYLNPSIVEGIMRMCERFNVNDHVKFHSLELVNKWMELLADEFRTYSKKERKHEAKSHKHNITLVIASCIQLASKSVGRQTIDFYEISGITDYLNMAYYQGTANIMVSASAIFQFMTSIHPKLKHTLDDIINSEQDVFKRFAFNLKATNVMEVIESIIVIFVPKAIEFQKIYALCLIAVDFYYLRKAEIFGEYHKLMVKSGIKLNTRMFNRHQSNYIFIAVAIIHLIISQDPCQRKPNISLLELQTITGILSSQIACLAEAFSKFLLVKDDLLKLQREASTVP